MIQTIAIWEAGASTIAASVAITAAVIFFCRARNLDAEVRSRVADITWLSAQADKSRNRKPGPSKRQAERAKVAVKAAELRGEVASK